MDDVTCLPMGMFILNCYGKWEHLNGNGPPDPPEGGHREGRLPGHLREGFGGASANLTGN